MSLLDKLRDIRMQLLRTGTSLGSSGHYLGRAYDKLDDPRVTTAVTDLMNVSTLVTALIEEQESLIIDVGDTDIEERDNDSEPGVSLNTILNDIDVGVNENDSERVAPPSRAARNDTTDPTASRGLWDRDRDGPSLPVTNVENEDYGLGDPLVPRWCWHFMDNRDGVWEIRRPFEKGFCGKGCECRKGYGKGKAEGKFVGRKMSRPLW